VSLAPAVLVRFIKSWDLRTQVMWMMMN